MKKKCKITYFVLSLLMMLISIQSIHGLISNKGISVGYLPNYKEMYEMKVIVIGDGYLLDQDYKIRDYTMNYQLKPGDSKVFKIHPNEKSRLKSIIFNSKDITKSLNSKDEIEVVALNHNSVLIVTFESIEDEVIDEEKPEKPIIPEEKPPTEEKVPEKEIITIIVKDIPKKDIDEITDEFLKKYIDSNLDYTILSHNVQNKPGAYEIVIQFPDGSIETLEIKVVGENIEDLNAIRKDQCYIHWIILFLLILFTIYSLNIYYRNYKKIKLIKKYGLTQTKDMKNTKNYIYILIAVILQFVNGYCYFLRNCSFDVFICLLSAITIICLVAISQFQERRYHKIVNWQNNE